MELTTRKPIAEYQLTNTIPHSKKGVRGFCKKDKTKATTIGLRLTNETKAFIEDYCKVNDISITALILAGLECYTGYNGSNHEEVIEQCKQWNEQ